MAILGNQHHQAVDATLDRPRLMTQYERVLECMEDGRWHTQYEIAEATGAPQGSVGSQLRNARVSGHTIEKRRRGDSGTWEYRLVGELKQADLL
jgi:hypothetical protein